MTLSMPRPMLHEKGAYYLNVRVPKDLADRVRGTRISLLVAGRQVVVTASDKVFVSLRTKDPGLAKSRFVEAHAALSAHWDGVRGGPKPLCHRQLVALAGYTYRRVAARYDQDPSFVPDGVDDARRSFRVAVDEWRYGDGDGLGEMPEADALYLATAQLPRGAQVLAWELKQDIDYHGIAMTYDQAVQDLFGAEADRLCAERHLVLDKATRLRLLREVGEAMRLVIAKVCRNSDGDYSPDQAPARFPPFEAPSAAASGDRCGAIVDVSVLFERWKAYAADKRAASTLRRYGPSLASLHAFLKGCDVTAVSQDAVHGWAEHRRDQEGIAAATVNRNDLVAVSAVFQWATTREGGRLRGDNPAKGVRLEPPQREVSRDPTFLDAEIKAILRLARTVAHDPRHPQASASRRWAPWLCAYSGARIQEVCWLRKQDVWCEAGIWVIRFPKSKSGRARIVPIHEELVREGFLLFWNGAPEGLLFADAAASKGNASRSAPEMRASQLAAWIQKHVELEPGVSPNHGWRHSFATNIEAAGVSRVTSNALTGHGKRNVSERYVTPSIPQLKEAVDRLPPYLA